MVLVWTNPEQPSLKQMMNWSLLCGFKMVTNNSMFDPILLWTTVDSLMVSRKQVKTRDDLKMVKKEGIQVVRLISRDFVYFKPFLLQLPPRGGGKGKEEPYESVLEAVVYLMPLMPMVLPIPGLMSMP